MRIDVFLKKTLIFKRRSEAKKMCDNNLIRVNCRVIKPSKAIQPGDVIEIDTLKGTRKLTVLTIPQGNISKNTVEKYYEET